MKFLSKILILFILALPYTVFAQDVVVPDVDLSVHGADFQKNNEPKKTEEKPLPSKPIPVQKTTKIVAFGDNLMSGLGISKYQAVPSFIELKFRMKNYKNIRVYNESKAGDTSYKGLRRIDDVLRHHPDVVILELGINDVKEKRTVQEIYQSLEIIVRKLQEKKIKVVLVGMEIPIAQPKAKMTKSEEDSYKARKEYAAKFSGMYAYLAKQYNLPFYPYLMKDITADKHLLNADLFNPNEHGTEAIAKNLMPVLEPVVYELVKGN